MGSEVFAKAQAGQGKFSGKVIGGKYLLTETLGEGAEGVIYAGHARYDENQRVAVKIGYTEAGHSRDTNDLPTDPVLREHAVLLQLKTPFTPRVIEAGFTGAGYPFSVRELIEGSSVARLLKRNASPGFANAMKIGEQLCQAIGAIHDLGFLHRDIKPANVMVSLGQNGQFGLKLIDFGASCRLGHEVEENGEDPKGTPAYMAPERALGKAAGVEGDLYAVGAILYEVFTGKALLGPDAYNLNTALQILKSDRPIPEIPLQQIRPDIPPEIAFAIRSLVSREPEERRVELAPLVQLFQAYFRPAQFEANWFFSPGRAHALLPPEKSESFLARLLSWFRG